MRPIAWKIYYMDGTTYTSKQGGWVGAPSMDVIGGTIYYDERDITSGQTYRRQRLGADFYWLVRGTDWNIEVSPNTEGIPVPANLPPGYVKQGVPMAENLLREKFALMYADSVWEG